MSDFNLKIDFVEIYICLNFEATTTTKKSKKENTIIKKLFY